MKNRILYGWSIRRILYIFMGVLIIIQSSIEHQWLPVLFGAYFASMGIFGFGCASGNCYTGYSSVDQKETPDQQITYEEISK